jgi:hypothetical protein
MRATLAYTLPDEVEEFEVAMQAASVLELLRRISGACSDALAHPDSDDGETRLAEEIIDMMEEIGLG